MVSQDVVHALEPVQIKEMQRERAITAPSTGQLTLKPVLQQQPVRQVGERIMMRHVPQPAFRLLALSDIERAGQHADNSA